MTSSAHDNTDNLQGITYKNHDNTTARRERQPLIAKNPVLKINLHKINRFWNNLSRISREENLRPLIQEKRAFRGRT